MPYALWWILCISTLLTLQQLAQVGPSQLHQLESIWSCSVTIWQFSAVVNFWSENMESSFTRFLLKVLCKLWMAAWSLILQWGGWNSGAGTSEQQPVKWESHGKGSYWEQEWQPGRKRMLVVGWSLRGAYLPSINPKDQVFEGEKVIFHLGLEAVFKNSIVIKWGSR